MFVLGSLNVSVMLAASAHTESKKNTLFKTLRNKWLALLPKSFKYGNI
jgi:hypothetical protein